MSTEIDYGNLNKRVVFTENDHRHAKLLVRLRYDGLTQSGFFRHLITGYIEGDERIQEFIDSVKTQSLKKKGKSKKLRHQGKQNIQELGLGEQKLIEDLFDLIAEEHPDL
ncbi:hypothetical protein CMI37_15970 [Candidatus Pacearchaeota archaeon]|nr:hypothetical protein [Candidatus Pacearchaeota archaeon]|tara:strand:- start:502 stop:831 length:330 start_codon:yes stop_codon:yes gene_type:complete